MPLSDVLVTPVLVACGAVVALLPAVWPFFYVASPVPAPFDCLEPEHPFIFKCSEPEDQRIVNHDFDTCWMRVPFTSHPLMGLGMPGFDPGVSGENDDTFTTLFVLYVLAVAVSCVGAIVSSRMILLVRRSGTYHAPNYRRYLRALVCYFLMQTLINFCAAIAFVDNRCHYHNVDLRAPHLRGVAGSPWAGRPETEPNPVGSYVARALCTISTTTGGVATNVVLELVLLRKARMVEGVDHMRRLVKAVAWLVVAQLLLLPVGSVGAFFSLTLPMLMKEPNEDGSVSFNELFDTDGDGEISPDENPATTSAMMLMCVGLVHVFVSVALCYVFAKLLTTAQRRDNAGSGGGVANRGRAEVTRTAVVRRVTISTVIAVFSTLLCYVNFVAGFASWLVMLAIDSMVNDVCLLWVAVTSEVDDAATAQEAELETMREVITTMGPFKLLSWRESRRER